MFKQIGGTINPIVNRSRIRFSSEELYYSIINPDDGPRHAICIPSSPTKEESSNASSWMVISLLLNKLILRRRSRVSPIHTVPEHLFSPRPSSTHK
jgi:hypothetical protein